jgi:hypothetical protein
MQTTASVKSPTSRDDGLVGLPSARPGAPWSLVSPLRATSGRSQTVQRTGQVDPKLLFVAKTERRKSNVERTYRIAAVDAHMGPIPDVRGGRGIVWIPPN